MHVFLHVGVEGAYNWLAFEGGARSDGSFTGAVNADYEVLPWFLVGVGYRLESRDSSSTASSLNLTRHEVMLNLTVLTCQAARVVSASSSTAHDRVRR